MSRLPDWLHPWRWYAATVIIEALYRHLILRETPCTIGIRFGRSREANQWRSLRRWRGQVLLAPTLWGWPRWRLGVGGPGPTQNQGRVAVAPVLGEMGV